MLVASNRRADRQTGNVAWETGVVLPFKAGLGGSMGSLGIRRVEFVTIYSKNLTAAKRFYVEALEFPLMREVANEFFQINVAGVPVCIDFDETATQHNNIGILVDDLDVTLSALRNKGLVAHSGSNPASTEKWVTVEDPDGNEVIFLTPKDIQ